MLSQTIPWCCTIKLRHGVCVEMFVGGGSVFWVVVLGDEQLTGRPGGGRRVQVPGRGRPYGSGGLYSFGMV